MNGSRERNNNFLLDGVDNNDTSVPGGSGGVLSANPDSTQEFRVITNNFNAEYGRNTGAIIDVVTKSGTNTFHGNAYEFGRWNAFGGARDWFNRTDAGKQDPYIRNQFGYSIGGPIIKNKTFFFFNHELDRFRTTLTNNATVPTAAFKTGVFNYFGDPVDLTQAGANNGTGNIAISSRPDHVCGLPRRPDHAENFRVCIPTRPSTTAMDSRARCSSPAPRRRTAITTVAKIDHHFTDRETFSVRYGYDDFIDPNPGHADIPSREYRWLQRKSDRPGTLCQPDFHLELQPDQLLQFRLEQDLRQLRLHRHWVCWTASFPRWIDSATAGTSICFPSPVLAVLALVSDGQYRKTGTTSYTDNLSWSHGNHTFKFGGDFRNVGRERAERISFPDGKSA